jgi:hypothetical protein
MQRSGLEAPSIATSMTTTSDRAPTVMEWIGRAPTALASLLGVQIFGARSDQSDPRFPARAWHCHTPRPGRASPGAPIHFGSAHRQAQHKHSARSATSTRQAQQKCGEGDTIARRLLAPLSLDFLGFSRPNLDFSMGYADFSPNKISSALPPCVRSPERERSLWPMRKEGSVMEITLVRLPIFRKRLLEHC